MNQEHENQYKNKDSLQNLQTDADDILQKSKQFWKDLENDRRETSEHLKALTLKIDSLIETATKQNGIPYKDSTHVTSSGNIDTENTSSTRDLNDIPINEDLNTTLRATSTSPQNIIDSYQNTDFGNNFLNTNIEDQKCIVNSTNGLHDENPLSTLKNSLLGLLKEYTTKKNLQKKGIFSSVTEGYSNQKCSSIQEILRSIQTTEDLKTAVNQLTKMIQGTPGIKFQSNSPGLHAITTNILSIAKSYLESFQEHNITDSVSNNNNTQKPTTHSNNSSKKSSFFGNIKDTVKQIEKTVLDKIDSIQQNNKGKDGGYNDHMDKNKRYTGPGSNNL